MSIDYNDVTICCGKSRAVVTTEGDTEGFEQDECQECGEPVCESCAGLFEKGHSICAICCFYNESEW